GEPDPYADLRGASARVAAHARALHSGAAPAAVPRPAGAVALQSVQALSAGTDPGGSAVWTQQSSGAIDLRSADCCSGHEVELENGPEHGESPIRILDLDRRHPELARRLEVAADIVEERDARRRHAQLLADQRVDPRIGLAQTDHRRLDEDVEVRVQARARCLTARRSRRIGHPVVGESGDPAATRTDSPDRLEHAR